MPVAARPLDRFPLRRKRSEIVVGVIFDDVVVDARPLLATFRTSFDVHVGHRNPSLDPDVLEAVGVRPAVAVRLGDRRRSRDGAPPLTAVVF